MDFSHVCERQFKLSTQWLVRAAHSTAEASLSDIVLKHLIHEHVFSVLSLLRHNLGHALNPALTSYKKSERIAGLAIN